MGQRIRVQCVYISFANEKKCICPHAYCLDGDDDGIIFHRYENKKIALECQTDGKKKEKEINEKLCRD